MKTKNDISIGEALDMMINELNLKEKLDESRIKQAWAEVMGATIARYTSTVAYNKGKLYIKVESAALKHELNYSRQKIKEVFNKELGREVILDVIIH